MPHEKHRGISLRRHLTTVATILLASVAAHGGSLYKNISAKSDEVSALARIKIPCIDTDVLHDFDRSSRADIESPPGDCLAAAFNLYGEQFGKELTEVMNQYGAEAGNAFYEVRAQHGQAVAREYQRLLPLYSEDVVQSVRRNYLPAISQRCGDELLQVKAMRTVAAVLNATADRRSSCYQALGSLGKTLIYSADSSTLLEHEFREWISSHAAFLKGTEVEADPAKVVAYILVMNDPTSAISEIKMIPMPDGTLRTCNEALLGNNTPTRISSAVLDLVSVVESQSGYEDDPDSITSTARAFAFTFSHIQAASRTDFQTSLKNMLNTAELWFRFLHAVMLQAA